MRKLWKYKLKNGQRFRRVTYEEKQFFRTNFGIGLTENMSSSVMRKSKPVKGNDRKVWYNEEQDK